VAGGVGEVGIGRVGRRTPQPGVLEGKQLCIGGVAGLVAEDDVVFAVRVERWIEVDQVDRGVRNVSAQAVEVVAVVEDVGGEVRYWSPAGLRVSVVGTLAAAQGRRDG
jgi:hypothetical protein